ncbi:MAG: efflux RND transporter periplasmic adaptor subunit [Planctomycetales bacterium]|nr:efflux RND transporter periplasmic adaptor subunit [Planctomycetales bacterium]
MKNTFLVTMLATAGIFAAGLAAGYSLTRSFPDTNGHVHGEEDDHAHDEHEEDPEVVQLTEESYKNLSMEMGNAEVGDHTRTIRIPARVIELPGHSDHRLAAPVNGIVEKLYVRPGQAISPGDPVLLLQVIDEPLLDAQLKLLDTITQLAVNAADTERLQPLADVRGRQLIDLKYQRQQLAAKEKLYRQELLVRGLTPEQISSIVSDQQLVRDLMIRLPDRMTSREDFHIAHDGKLSFTIERLRAVPGTTVSRGDDLCHLAYHAALYIEGQAFEKDLPLLEELHESGATFTIEFGAGKYVTKHDGAKIEYIDNAIDEHSQTYSFYVPIKNEIVSEQTQSTDVRFRTWKFKPGQRAHVLLPTNDLVGYLKLPAEAVVTDGPDAFVFRRYVTPHDHDHDHDHVDPYVELKRTPIHLIYRDKEVALVEANNDFKDGQRMAINNAFELNLILKTRAGDGGGHDHGHEH